MKPFLLLFFCLITLGCQKEELTIYNAHLTNSTNHEITLLSYKKGVVLITDTIKLKPNERFKIANGFNRGISVSPGFSSNFFGDSNDSIKVVFDKTFSVTHYANLPDKLNKKYYLFNSLRNCLNANSYVFVSTKLSKYKLQNTHEYIFVEEDYLYAK
jgi:hypothetical protein